MLFRSIKNLKVNFNNRVNLLATYTESDLWSMSCKNGLVDSFNEWKHYTGSLCIIDIVADFGVEAGETDGQSNKFSTLQISGTLSAAPLSYAAQTTALAYDFYVLVEQPGKCFISASECQYILTAPSEAEVLKLTSDLSPKVDSSVVADYEVGGSLGLGKLMKSAVDGIKQVNPQDVAKGVEIAQNAMKSLGMGVAGGAVKKHSRVY